MKILKFGGKSLANGQGIKRVLEIITEKIQDKEQIIIVLSARGDTTNKLELLLDLAKENLAYKKELAALKKYQLAPLSQVDLQNEFDLISDLLKGVQLTKDYSLKTKDLVLAQGELMGVKTLYALLAENKISSKIVDSRQFFKTDDNFGNANILSAISEKATRDLFKKLPATTLALVPGFIASNSNNDTTTLGRNGSNYSTSLLANYLNVSKVENYTHIDGIFTANPEIVQNAKIIDHINYSEASELASFGAAILHQKSIIPLMEKDIPLRILNTFNPKSKGTLISQKETLKGIKSISLQEDVSLINITGKGLWGKRGIDARLFSKLSLHDISVGIISQGSSERGVSFIVPKPYQTLAISLLHQEFQPEISNQDLQEIKAIGDITVLTIIGQNIEDFSSSLDYLKQNNIEILLINNTINGNNIGLVIRKKDVRKAVNVIHAQIFGAIKTINIAVIGKGTVGASFINQVLKSKKQILNKKQINLNIFAVAGTTQILLDTQGINEDWQALITKKSATSHHGQAIIDFATNNHLENLILIDNTASEEIVEQYHAFIESGFDLISSNKIANTQSYAKYHKIRQNLSSQKKKYLYETNVGAGLPIIDTIRILHDSGENITRIKGVLSGSLSYLFNAFSTSEKPFSYFLQEAMKKGYTEPDPREDLCGNDVARKLLILARELDLENEFDEIEIDNLIPENLRIGTTADFLNQLEELDVHYQKVKAQLKEGEVLRYVGDLYGDLQQRKGKLKVSLEIVSADSALGNLKGSDSFFGIYTESYEDNPITIIGAGAGAEVTARGVFGDLLRISDKK